jgi:serine protease Do
MGNLRKKEINRVNSAGFMLLCLFALTVSQVSPGVADTAQESSLKSPFRSVAEKVVPAVVSLEVAREFKDAMSGHPFYDQFRQFMPEKGMPDEHQDVPGSGSGFLIDRTGLIVTNNHVVRDAKTIKVILPGEKSSYDAEVLGTDPKTDLAVIRIIDPAGREFPFVEQGDSDSARVGDWAIAIGNPMGELEGSLTVGVISAKGRTNLAIAGQGPSYQDFIQTDAAINFGNSGGPLVDIDGRVIGINTAINASGQGIGFAIPINLAAKIIPQLIEKGSVTRAYMGVIPRELDLAYAEALGLEIERGILIEDVLAGAPADRAGLHEGDVIIEFNGVVVDDVDRFRFLVAEQGVGDKVSLMVHRDGKVVTKKVKLTEFPDEAEADAVRETPTPDNWFGMSVEELTESGVVDDQKAQADFGVIVTRISPGSAAERAELRVGDVIQKIKSMKIENLEDFKKATDKFGKSGKRIGLLVQREAYSTFLFLAPEK